MHERFGAVVELLAQGPRRHRARIRSEALSREREPGKVIQLTESALGVWEVIV